MEFGDKVTREVMTPRPNLVAIQADATLEQLRQLVITEQYSRIPVYEQNIDQIVGFVHVRDMFEVDEAEREGRKCAGWCAPSCLCRRANRCMI
jgi:putative hemolysin